MYLPPYKNLKTDFQAASANFSEPILLFELELPHPQLVTESIHSPKKQYIYDFS